MFESVISLSATGLRFGELRRRLLRGSRVSVASRCGLSVALTSLSVFSPLRRGLRVRLFRLRPS